MLEDAGKALSFVLLALCIPTAALLPKSAQHESTRQVRRGGGYLSLNPEAWGGFMTSLFTFTIVIATIVNRR